MIKLVAIDMDGTLLREDKTYDEARFKAAVTALTAQGVQVCIASGNSYRKLYGYFDDETRDMLAFAATNGNEIILHVHPVDQKTLSVPVTQRIVDFLSEFEDFYSLVATNEASYAVTRNQEALDYFSRYNPEIRHLESFDQLTVDEPILQISVMSKRTIEENKVMVRILNERFIEAHAVTSGGRWIDVFHHAGGKGSAIRYFQAENGYGPEACMTIGDSPNDYTMMLEADYSVAMGNADADLVAECRYQIGNNEVQAVVDVLERLVDDPTAAFMEEYRLKQQDEEEA